MVVLIGFLIAVFVVGAWQDLHGRPLRLRWLMTATFIVAASFYSLRVIS